MQRVRTIAYVLWHPSTVPPLSDNIFVLRRSPVVPFRKGVRSGHADDDDDNDF